MSIFFLYLIIYLLIFNFALKKYIKIAYFYNVVSIPKNRDSHKTLKPKGAGIIFFIFFLAFLIINKIYSNEIDFNYLVLLSIPLISIFSFADDIYDINWKYKILVDIVTAIIIIFLFKDYIDKINFSKSLIFILYLFLIFSITWFINLINFSDGSDGYLTLFTIINIFLNLLIKYYSDIEINYFNILFCSTLVIFLYYNLYKSNIFLGDSGSRLIAIILIINILYDYFTYDLFISLIWFLTILIVFIDTGITILQRIVINKVLLKEHKDHAYQILANKYNHKISILWIIFNFGFIIVPSILLYLNNIVEYLYLAFFSAFIISYQIIYIKIKLKCT